MTKEHFKGVGVIGVMVYAVAALVLSMIVYWGLEEEPITVERPFPDFDVVESGKTAIFFRRVCSTKEIMVTVQREIVNLDTGKTVEIGNTSYVIGVGCTEKNYQLPIADFLPEGNYEYRPTVIYDVNPIVIKNYKLQSIKFEIRK